VVHRPAVAVCLHAVEGALLQRKYRMQSACQTCADTQP
jgi:hypothetical protein